MDHICINGRQTSIEGLKDRWFRTLTVGSMLVIMILLSAGCSDSSTVMELSDEIEVLQSQEKKLESMVNDLEVQNQELQKDNKDLMLENQTLQAKIDQASPWFEMSEQEQKDMETELQKQKETDELKAQEEAAKGYDTGIKYSQLARKPNDYIGKKVKFKGKVVQVIEGDGETQLRIAVDSDYDKIIYVYYDSSIVSSRVLEDDKITIMGVSQGLISYESTMGGVITIPCISVDIIKF